VPVACAGQQQMQARAAMFDQPGDQCIGGLAARS
jgi:hypothetical protein